MNTSTIAATLHELEVTLQQVERELTTLREYRDHHEFVVSQIAEVAGREIKTIGDVLDVIRGQRSVILADGMSDELKKLLQSYLATSVVTQDLIDRIDAEFRCQQSVITKLTKDYNSLEDDVHYNRDFASEHQDIFDAIRDEADRPIYQEYGKYVPIPYAVWKRAVEKARTT